MRSQNRLLSLLYVALGGWVLVVASPLLAAPTVDGTLTDTDYQLLGDNQGGPAPGFGVGHEVNALYAYADNGALYIGVAGNVQSGNRILVFIDSKAGGYNGGGFGRAGAPQGIDDFNSGTTFDAGFTADYALVIGTSSAHDNFFFDLYTLSASGGPSSYLGDKNDADLKATPLNGSRTQGFEVRLTHSITGASADFALSQPQLKLFAMYISDAGYLSNQFITHADAGESNYTGGAVSFGAAAPNPVQIDLTPSATADSYATTEDVTLSIAAPGVRANDSCIGNCAAVLVDQAAKGTVTLDADGSFTYVPNADTNGTDSFTYKVSNGADSSTVTVTLNVAAVNDAPRFVAITNPSVSEGDTVSFTATVTDPEGDTVTLSLDPGAPAAATFNPATGAFSWATTEADGPGVYEVTIRATDNGTPSAEDTVKVTITVAEVNLAPVLAAIGNKTVDELATVSFTATATDADAPANTLAFSLDPGAPAGAAITSGGAFSWTPTEGQGPATWDITVIVTDNGSPALSASETIKVTVREINQAPVLAAIGDKSVDELTALTFTASATDGDAPANTLTFSLGTGAPSGAAITPTGAFSWTPTEAQGSGSYSITIIVADNGVPVLFDSETITVTVNEVSAAPVLAAIGDKSIDEETLLSFTASASDPDNVSTSLTFSLGPDAPTGAAITSGGDFTWTPTEAQGPASYDVTIIVSDGALTDSETFKITVSEVNVAPVLATIGNKSVDEHANLTFTATATDADLPENSLTYTLDTDAPAGASITSDGVFTWTPDESQGGGDHSVTIIVSDGTATDNETLLVSVAETNTAPVLAAIGAKSVDEGQSLSFTATATDSDDPANTLTFSLDPGAPAGAAITSGGDFTWTPTEAQGPGDYDITVRVTDDGSPASSDSETITVTVAEVNTAPVLAAIGNKSVDEHATLSFTATATDADLPANSLTFALATGAPAGAAITNAGAFTWTPSESQGGSTYDITITVTDNATTAASDSETIQVTVAEVDDPPSAVADAYATRQGEVLVIAAPGVLQNDTEPEGGTLTAVVDATPAHGTLTLASDGGFTYTPTASYTGSDSFTYHASDASLSSAVTTVTLTVVAVTAGDTCTTAVELTEGQALTDSLQSFIDDYTAADCTAAALAGADGFYSLTVANPGYYRVTLTPQDAGADLGLVEVTGCAPLDCTSVVNAGGPGVAEVLGPIQVQGTLLVVAVDAIATPASSGFTLLAERIDTTCNDNDPCTSDSWNGTACTHTQTCPPPGCGNAYVDAGEQCDDGNNTNGDGCDTNCTTTGCGNGIITEGEECDDGNTVEGDGCDTNCTDTSCGNGIVTDGEACDDGNTANGDGCDRNCTLSGCGNGAVSADEDCDDGNTLDGDGCDSNCTVTACGNGIVSYNEECDDGNRDNGDGCTASCLVEHSEPGSGGDEGGGCAAAPLDTALPLAGLLLLAMPLRARRRKRG